MSQHRWPSSSGSYEPLTYIRGVALDVTTLITAVHVFCLLLVTIFLAAKHGNWADYLVFKATFLSDRHPWTLLTYPFYHDIRMENLFFALEMLMFYWFGREVERFIGRNAFAWFYALLCLLPPVALTAISRAGSLPLDYSLSGSSTIHLAVFLGFVVIYPNTQVFFGLVSKWVAAVLLGIATLYYLALHNWFALSYFWLTMMVSWSMLRMAGVGGGFGWWNSFESWRLERADRKVQARRARHRQARAVEEQTVDEILEKISHSGIASLNDRERAVLERTRQKLVQRDSGRSS